MDQTPEFSTENPSMPRKEQLDQKEKETEIKELEEQLKEKEQPKE